MPRLAGWSYLLLVVLAAVVLTGCLSPYIGIGACGRLAILLAAWTGLWAAGTRALRRWGPGLGLGMMLTLSSVCMALPVAAMPLVRAAAHWGSGVGVSPWQNRLVEVIGHACPCFPILEVLRTSPAEIRIDWGTLPEMYAWSGLGQEISLALPSVWSCSALYAGGALLVMVGAMALRKKAPSSAVPRES
jgi:hypothetical protein